MILADKIIKLRKQNGWSQEELADQMNVSRQSVSKWESTLSIPDMDKIIKLSKLFGVSTDYLLMDTLDDVQYSEYDDTTTRTLSLEAVSDYLAKTEQANKRISWGVMACIVSPIVLIVLTTYSEAFPKILDEKVATAVGLFFLFALIVFAVMTFVNEGIKLSHYKYLENEVIDLEYGVHGVIKKRSEAILDAFRSNLLLSLALIFIGVIQLVIGGIFENETVAIYQVAILLILVGLAVQRLVYYGTVKESYSKILQENDYTIRNKKIRKDDDVLHSIYWGSTVALYLLISFTTMSWEKTWIIWPIAGVMFGVIKAVSDARR